MKQHIIYNPKLKRDFWGKKSTCHSLCVLQMNQISECAYFISRKKHFFLNKNIGIHTFLKIETLK